MYIASSNDTIAGYVILVGVVLLSEAGLLEVLSVCAAGGLGVVLVSGADQLGNLLVCRA